jgi:hypothetical protein
MKNKHIIEGDKSSTMLVRATKCCGGGHQTIAGALLGSPQWAKWYAHASKNMLYDVDECCTIDAMSTEHFNSFIDYCIKTKNNAKRVLQKKRGTKRKTS